MYRVTLLAAFVYAIMRIVCIKVAVGRAWQVPGFAEEAAARALS
jgi:Ni/Fe-hydrogenase subunit HybB-like protein